MPVMWIICMSFANGQTFGGAKVISTSEGYIPPTPAEMAPMPRRYLAALAKVKEQPEMADIPFQTRKTVSPNIVEIGRLVSILGNPEKVSVKKRKATIRQILSISKYFKQDGPITKSSLYGLVAEMECLDGENPKQVINYLNHDINDDAARALRARMYLRLGNRKKTLDDLAKLMIDNNAQVLDGGGTDPQQKPSTCNWTLKDFNDLGKNPKAISAKAFYLSAFIGYGAEERGTVKEADIRSLYTQAEKDWSSPLPYFLEATFDDYMGSRYITEGVRCIRKNLGLGESKSSIKNCTEHDARTREKIRELSMALIVDPAFAPAVAERAEYYLQLGLDSYADGMASKHLFDLAINDFNAAIASGGKSKGILGLEVLYDDRGLALASIGKYQAAAASYERGIKRDGDGAAVDSDVYENLADLYMKLHNFNKAVSVLTQAIMNSAEGLRDVILISGIKSFRTLYPEYEFLPDKVLAEVVRRRYYPQFPESWDASFISGSGKILSSILPELYTMRGDAYMKSGHTKEGLADYQRVKCDVWSQSGIYSPKNVYFNNRGQRRINSPEIWPPPPPTS